MVRHSTGPQTLLRTFSKLNSTLGLEHPATAMDLGTATAIVHTTVLTTGRMATIVRITGRTIVPITKDETVSALEVASLLAGFHDSMEKRYETIRSSNGTVDFSCVGVGSIPYLQRSIH
jgi:hypothetical protein